jgi:malonyl CoA-acyl carrier protein transacylase
MAQAAPGGMAAIIGIDAAKVAEVLANAGLSTIDVANYNQATQTVISGLREEVTGAQAAFEAAGAMFIPLNVGGAFHSRYMQPAATEFERFLQGFRFAAPRVPVIANVTGKPHEDGRIAETLARQLTHSVRWADSMHYLLQQGVTEFVEAGPRDVLTKMIRGIRSQWKPQPAAAAAAVAEPPRAALPATDVVAAWNRNHPVGTRVSARGYEQPIATRTPAMVLFGHRAAVYLQGYNGYFALEDLRPV